MTKRFRLIYLHTLFALAVYLPSEAFALFTNYNSVMLGDRAGGMGGAATALTGDSAASAYYNPATLARLEGSSLSTSVSLFNKYDVTYGNQQDLNDALFRINKGSILSIPSASGIFSSFRNFTAGLSIVLPDFQTFGGDIYTSGDSTTFLRLDDKSLWVGGALGFNISETQALGLTVYYTSQSSSRSLTNRYDTGSEIVVLNEEKTFSANSIVSILGHYVEITPNLKLGTSYRFRSIAVASKGSFIQSEIGTVSGAQPLISENNLAFENRIPDKLTIGLAYNGAKNSTITFDASYYGSNDYLDSKSFGDRIVQNKIVNYAIGYERYVYPWLALRLGLFTDYASSPKIPKSAIAERLQDHIDKYGFSANIGIHTTAHTTISLGGYYLGGDGYATEKIGPGFQRVEKDSRLFSFLVGSAYSF